MDGIGVTVVGIGIAMEVVVLTTPHNYALHQVRVLTCGVQEQQQSALLFQVELSQ